MKNDATKRQDALGHARALVMIIHDLESGGIIDDPKESARLIMRLAKKINDFGLSLAEEENAEGNRNADGNADIVTFY